jgi:hypothetical protein
MGNWTTAVPVELPTGAMPPGERLRRIRAGLRSSVERGEPLAAGAVMRLTGLLPPAAHAWFARQTYSDRFLNLIVTYLPGPRGEFSFAGAPVRTMYPLAPLTRNVPLSFGMITTSTTAGLGVLVDPALGLDRAVVEAALQRAFAAFVEA